MMRWKRRFLFGDGRKEARNRPCSFHTIKHTFPFGIFTDDSNLYERVPANAIDIRAIISGPNGLPVKQTIRCDFACISPLAEELGRLLKTLWRTDRSPKGVGSSRFRRVLRIDHSPYLNGEGLGFSPVGFARSYE